VILASLVFAYDFWKNGILLYRKDTTMLWFYFTLIIMDTLSNREDVNS